MEGEELVFYLIGWVISGSIAAAIAHTKGRNPVGWFFGGALLGCVGIIIVAVLPNIKEQENFRHQTQMRERRLQEQLLQEQVKNEAFRRHAMGRIDHHDEHLGIDTRSLPQNLPSNQNPQQLYLNQTAGPPPLTPTGTSTESLPVEWYVMQNQQRVGPMTVRQVANMWQADLLQPASLVWSPRLNDWVPVHQIPEVVALLS